MLPLNENRSPGAGLGWAVDCHVHSSCSWDGSASMEEFCLQAVRMGLGGIVFTEHLELDPDGKGYLRFDYDLARAELEAARARFPELELGLGVEVTYLRSREEDIRRFLRGRQFDVVMGSIHQVQGVDCSDPREAARVWSGEIDPCTLLDAYFSELKSAVESGLFDVLGHPDVFLRLGRERWLAATGKVPDAARGASGPAADVPGRMGEVLDLVVRASMAIDVNSSGLRRALGHPHPGPDTLAAYRSRGGTLITMGSDAHFPAHLGWGFAEVADYLRHLGFGHAYFYRSRKPVPLPLPAVGGARPGGPAG